MTTKYAFLSRSEILAELRWQLDHRKYVDKELCQEIANRMANPS